MITSLFDFGSRGNNSLTSVYKKYAEKDHPMTDKEDISYKHVNEQYYRDTRKNHNFIVMREMKALRRWRILAIIAISAFLIRGAFVYRYLLQPRLVPYVIEFDRSSGSYDFKGILTGSYDPDSLLIQSGIRDYIRDMRSVYLDKPHLISRLAVLYAVSGSDARRYINENLIEIDDENPLMLSDDGFFREVSFISFQLISDQTYYVRWNELVRRDGAEVSSFNYTGTFTYRILEGEEFNALARDPRFLHENPIGLQVLSVAYSRDEIVR